MPLSPDMRVQEGQNDGNVTEEIKSSNITEVTGLQRNGRPQKKQFLLYQNHSQPIASLFGDFVAPFKLFLFPIVDFASFVVSWSASCFLILNLTQAQVFTAAPYHYGPQKIGFFNFAIMIGQFLGLATAGPLSDLVSMYATKHNNGVREPEMRLPTMIPFVLIMILGNFVAGFGYQHAWDWRVRLDPVPMCIT